MVRGIHGLKSIKNRKTFGKKKKQKNTFTLTKDGSCHHSLARTMYIISKPEMTEIYRRRYSGYVVI